MFAIMKSRENPSPVTSLNTIKTIVGFTVAGKEYNLLERA